MSIRNWLVNEVDNAGVPSSFLTFAGRPIADHTDMVVGVVSADTATSVSAVTDTMGNTYTRKVYAANGTDVRVELWEAQDVRGWWNNVVTVTFTGSTAAAAAWAAYTGVIPQTGGMTAQNTATSLGSDTRPGVVLAMQEIGNWAVAVVGLSPAAGAVPNPWVSTADSLGNLREYVWTTSVGILLLDTDVYGQFGDADQFWSAVPMGVHVLTPAPWAAVAVELRSDGVAPVDPPIDPGTWDLSNLKSWSFSFTESAPTPGPAQSAEVTCGFAGGGCKAADPTPGNTFY